MLLAFFDKGKRENEYKISQGRRHYFEDVTCHFVEENVTYDLTH